MIRIACSESLGIATLLKVQNWYQMVFLSDTDLSTKVVTNISHLIVLFRTNTFRQNILVADGIVIFDEIRKGREMS